MKKYIFIFAIMMCFCSCKEKFIELGNGYKLMSWDFGLMLVNQDRIVIVSDAITKYDFNDKFIIIKQKPFDLITKDIIQKQPFGKVVACFRHSKIRQYWIIRKDQLETRDKKTNNFTNVYGPYQEAEFIKKQKEFGVPDTLKFIPFDQDYTIIDKMLDSYYCPDTIGL